MKVYVVRHGDKAEGDYFNEYLKHQDEPLSESGEAKAKMLCTCLLYTSPSPRDCS